MKKQENYTLFYSGFKWDMLFIFVSGILSVAEVAFFETDLSADFPYMFIYVAYALARFIHILVEKKQRNKKKELKFDLIFTIGLAVILVTLNEISDSIVVPEIVIPTSFFGFFLGRFVGYKSNGMNLFSS